MSTNEEWNPLSDLLRKLDGWLMQQPEWPLLFLADRQTRRKVSRAVAARLTTLPTRGGVKRVRSVDAPAPTTAESPESADRPEAVPPDLGEELELPLEAE
jgi:hypothetical protein